jgi:hypothetical protein
MLKQKIKTCVRCGLSKVLEDFHNDTSKADQHSARCKACFKLQQAAYYLEHREVIKARVAAWKQSNRDKVNLAHTERYAADPTRYNAKSKKWKKENPEKVAASYRLSRYGVSQERYTRFLEIQHNCCRICDVEFSISNVPNVDHDHACCAGDKSCGNCIRGLLCRGCNHALGNLKDDPKLFHKAAAYLLGTQA